MIYIKTIAVSEEFYRTYADQTLPAAGYTILEPDVVENVTENRVDAVLCEGDAYSIQLLYTPAEETLTLTITPKA